ncbi:MAG: protein kinase [Ignavibacteriaceae bacterium]
MTRKIQSYEIIEPIGEGELGAVWKARHSQRNEIVSITSLSDQYTNNPEFRKRFLNEVQILTKLNHKNIVNIIDFIEEPKALHLVSEFIEGRTLDTILVEEASHISYEKALPLFIQILEGINYIHQQGVVHQQLNPRKIIVTPANTIKIADFGVAQLLGKIKKGTKKEVLFYMSPEQVRREQVDGQSDIYSLGIILYEMLAGRLPFDKNEAMSDFTLVNKIISEKLRDPREFYPDIPEWIVNIVNQATTKKRSARIKNADDFTLLLKSEKENFEKKIIKEISEKKELPSVKEDFGKGVKSIEELIKERQWQKGIETKISAEQTVTSKKTWKSRLKRNSPLMKRIAGVLVLGFWITVGLASFLIIYSGKAADTQWMTENLKVDHYKNGDPIPEVTDPLRWAKLKTGAWCYYRNDPEKGKKYGKLYNWYAVNDPRGLAPEGWQVASKKEFEDLKNTVNNNGDALKAEGEGNGTNTSGFSALLAGCRDSTGYYYDLGYVPYFWSATGCDTASAYNMILLYNDNNVTLSHNDMRYGLSVRCFTKTEKPLIKSIRRQVKILLKWFTRG